MPDNPYENYYRDENNKGDDGTFELNNQPANPLGYDFQSEVQEVIPNMYSEPTAENTADINYLNNQQAEEPSMYYEPAPNESTPVSYEWYGDSNPVYNPPKEYGSYEPIGNDYTKRVNSKEKGRVPVAVILLICMVVSSVFGGGAAFIVNYFTSGGNFGANGSGLTVNQVTPESGDGSYSTQGELSTVEIVDKYADSVVEIITESVTTGIFSQQYIQSGAGSGVIIDSKGYIVTNHHVIDGARKISVSLRNGETFAAQLIGSDQKEDLALLKIEAEGLTSAVMGDSDSLRVGQRTIAIGNPLGQLGGTVTEGIISALDRELVVDGQSMNLLQTDTAINPGNSGGGMFDGKGNLIGIVVAKSSGSEVEGLGFAIPINKALTVISDLMEFGYVRGRVNIGMEFLDVTSEASAWLYKVPEIGCYVYKVERNSNAEEAGFKYGDLILSVDGTDVMTTKDIEEIINKKNVGDTVEFSVKRNSRVGKISLVLEEATPDSQGSSEYSDFPEDYDSLIPWFDFG